MVNIFFKNHRPILSIVVIFLVTACTTTNLNPARQFKSFEVFSDMQKIGLPGPSMTVIPSGSFVMGVNSGTPVQRSSEIPQRRVTIENAFAISQHEITFELFDQFVSATGYYKPSDKGWGTKHWGRINTPVFNVNWHDANAYTEWLSEQTGYHYRLPTEAEWEYTARAGKQTPFSTGECIATDQANFHGRNSFGDCPVPTAYRGKVLPVASFEPNDWGLYDVHGNIFEWTQDCWHSNYQGAFVDGRAWLSEGETANCQRRVLRGGSWSSFVADVRSANRGHNDASMRSIFIGFRVARDLKD